MPGRCTCSRCVCVQIKNIARLPYVRTDLHRCDRSRSGAVHRGSSGWSVEHLQPDEDARRLAADPLHPGVVYAGTQGRGVLRSDDRGATWRPAGLAGQIVKALAVSRAEPDVVYAGTKPPLIFVSRNGGANWTELDAFRRIRSRHFWFSPAEPRFTAYVQGITLSPTDPSVIVAGIEVGAVVGSADGGQSWSDHRRGALRDCDSITFHPSDGQWVYEGGGTGAGVAFSRDAGVTWTQPRDGLDRHYGWAVAADPGRPDVWYASVSPTFLWSHPGPPAAHIDGKANAFIFRRTSDGPWHKLSGGLPQPLNSMAYTLLTDPTAPGHLYAGLSNGDVWHSADHGDTWRQLPFNLTGIHRTLIML